jgi:excisionase family DNA binding protein
MKERLAFSIAEAADAIGISRDTVYRLIQRGEIHSVLVGKRRLIPRASLLQLLGTTEEPEDRAAASGLGAISLTAPASSVPPMLPNEEEATFIVAELKAHHQKIV